MVQLFIVLTVALSLAFSVINGFRDVSSAVALAVRTRALTASIAVVLAAFFNVLGVAVCLPLAFTLANSWQQLPSGMGGLSILVSALAGGAIWNMIMWWRGMPSSSTHALFGGLLGACLAMLIKGSHQMPDLVGMFWNEVGLPLLVSPLIALVVSYILVVPITWLVRNTQPSTVNRRFRRSQAIAAGAVAFGHGLQDGQRAMLVLLLMLMAGGLGHDGGWPVLLLVLTAIAMAVGTLLGGWRISHTLGHRMIRVDPLRGSVAQGVAALLLFIGAIGLQWPISTTHTVTAGIWGAGTNQRFSGANRPLIFRIVGAWILTPFAAAAIAMVFQFAFSPLT